MNLDNIQYQEDSQQKKQKTGWREAGESEDNWHLSFVSIFDSWPILTMISEQHNQLDATAPSENRVLLACANGHACWHSCTKGEMEESLTGVQNDASPMLLIAAIVPGLPQWKHNSSFLTHLPERLVSDIISEE